MSDYHTPVTTMQPQPMRTAEEHHRIAGADSFCYAALAAEGLVFVQGQGGRAVMRKDEWQRYEVLRAAPAPVISMRQQTAAEESSLAAFESFVSLHGQLRSLRTLLNEARGCVASARRTLNGEDSEESLQVAETRLDECLEGLAEMLMISNEEGGPEAA